MPTMILHHTSANCQPDASTGVGLAVVQPLEHGENALPLVRVNADAVVAHAEAPLVTLVRHANMDDGGYIFAPVLDGIGKQILE